MGIEPTTSGLDLPLLRRLSYEVGQRKSGMGLISTLIYSSELILCSPFVCLVLRGTTFIMGYGIR